MSNHNNTIRIARLATTLIIAACLSPQALAKVRHCKAEWVAVNTKTGEQAYLESFEAAGGCSKFKPNECRERAKNYAAQCIKAHWKKRWDRTKPAECRRSEIKGYDMKDLKAVVEGAACYYKWDSPDQQKLKLVANIKGDKRCPWKSDVVTNYSITPAMCAKVKHRPVKKYIGNPAFKIPRNNIKEPRTGLMLPKSMPKVRFPKGYKGCSANDKKRIDRGWAMATYMAWLGDKAMDWMHNNGKYRKAAWNHNYRPSNNNSWTNYAPRGWFGAFNNKNFSVADNAIENLWGKRLQGKTFTVQCRTKGNSGSHPCFTSNPGGNGRPSANHIVYGKINFCAKALNGNADVYRDARRVLHELLHWQRAKTGKFITDTHTHCHGLARCTTDKSYGAKKASHLSNYEGGSRGTKKAQKRRRVNHRNKALHNNDNYAYYLYYFGKMAHTQRSIDGLPSFSRFPAVGFKW